MSRRSRSEDSSRSDGEDDPLETYDALAMEGRAPDPDIFAAAYPHLPDLRQRIVELEALRADMSAAAAALGESAPPPPATLGDFDLGPPLGRGGMGSVYAATARSTGQRCALKVLRYDSAVALFRFEREARLAASLSHPGIAPVLAFGVEKGLAYMVSERIDGESLADLLERKSDGIAPTQALTLALAVAQALAHAHERGVVHRDVKPSNIMVDRHGTARLIDFGLAIRPARRNERITRTGVFVGSHNYAAPEQLRGDKRHVGPWSDVYGLGATLYEMLTGRPPFVAPTITARLAQSDAKPAASPRALRPQISRRLDRVVMRALSPRFGKRYSSGTALAKALSECVTADAGREA